MNIPLVNLNLQHRHLSSQIATAINALLRRGDFILGTEVTKFEARFARFVDAKYAVGLDTGLSALELGMRALGIKPGDEVITPVNSFIASSSPISFIGATPVWIDADPVTYNLDLDRLETLITSKTRAIMPVHLYGQPVDMITVRKIARQYNLKVVEDACQAHGARYKDKPVGSWGDFAAFSFYPGKNLGSLGDAGMLTTNSKKLADTVRQMRNYGQTQKYHHRYLSWNRRLDTIQAAVLLTKLRYLRRWNNLRRHHAQLYTSLLSHLKQVITPQSNSASYHVYHQYVIQAERRDQLQAFLLRHGIHTGIHYPIPIHLQPAYRHFGKTRGSYPVAERLAKNILSLPMFPELKPSEISYVCAAITKFYHRVK